ncbi:MAG: site-specific integrase [Acidaminococcaceae bacterium]|nr:site-specific integrase [Acidaminococcaceae bacterium]
MPRIKKQRLKQRADGRYCCKYHGIQFMGATEDEALRAREAYKRAEAEGALVRRDQQTVGEYAQYWLPVHKSGVKPSTFNGYASVLEHAIAPMAKKHLAAITSDDIAECYADLSGRSASYIHKAKILITAMLDSATDAGYMLHNPARAQSLKPPKGTAGTHRAITAEERALILRTPHRMQLAALIMLYAGLRRGEVLALDAADIADVVTVRRAVYYVSNQPMISKPKTAAGVRRVPVLSVLRPFLRDLSGLVLQGSNGSYLTEQAWQRGWESYLRVLSAAAGHDIIIKPHDLRVSFCTMSRDAGVDMHQVMRWMGHADERMILRVYDQPGEEREKASKNLLEAAFGMQNGMQDASESPQALINQGV